MQNPGQDSVQINIVTTDDDESLLRELLKDPVTARLLLAWRRSVIALQQAEDAARTAGEGPPDWDVKCNPSNDDE